MLECVLQEFEEIFGNEGEIRVYFAPGRVNLIGEHTDYNGGHVLPCALTMGTYGAVRLREDRKLRFYSVNYSGKGVVESCLDRLEPGLESGWTNYPKGVMWAFEERGYSVPQGMDILIHGNIPNGSGLSSSASLEVLTGVMLNDLFGLKLTPVEIALLGQYAENEFIGCRCGIMDQFVSAAGRKDHAIFLNTDTMEYEYVPVYLDEAKLVIVNSKVKHSLADSAYNERRRECETSLRELQCAVKAGSLGELSALEYEINKGTIRSEIRQKRAKHAVYENQRTIRAVSALREDDVETFGSLMNESHISLRDDYEVSCPELDLLVELAWSTGYVTGSRMTGGGFGGCTVNIVEEENVEEFIRIVGEKYERETGLRAEFYTAEIGDGAGRLR